jgi:hydroxylamine dehydrogenase
MKRIILFIAISISILSTATDELRGREEFAIKTGKGCSFCHQSHAGGPINKVGLAYVRNNYQYPIPRRILEKSELISGHLHRTIRLIVGYIHLVAACIFVGAIFYVHIFIKPTRLTGGIPLGERKLGLSCMVTLLLSGIYLTWYRIDSPGAFLQSHFGILLLVKIILFAIMIASALTAVTVIHSRMRREKNTGTGKKKDIISRASISDYNGEEGRSAYVIYEDTVYDVSGSPKWEDGTHFRKHRAGADLTGEIDAAPHGEEVLGTIPVVSRLSGSKGGEEIISGTRRIFIVLAYSNMILTFLILLCVSSWLWGFPAGSERKAELKISSSTDCEQCHRLENPGIYHDWKKGVHSLVDISCSDCHRRQDDDPTISPSHKENIEIPVSSLVTPKTCAECHPQEAKEYARSKHAHTLEIINSIDRWMMDGMNNQIERTTGCYTCHGSVVRFETGHPVEGTWPNVGVGRVNPDGSLGSCTSCHTRHRFSLVEARKPEACDQCHLGPDHPQIEIYNESKHGTIYHAEGDFWNWRTDDMKWRAGRDYRAPTCASCHISQADTLKISHDVTGRLSWELQAPLTVRPSDFKPFPSGKSWEKERKKMKTVCLQCHSPEWTSGHFTNLDRVVINYNRVYYEPVRKTMDDLYSSGFLSDDKYFDDYLEWEFYEFWHHEGRRARMGAAMMAPDYAWWHGFYELKHRYLLFMEEADKIKKNGGKRSYCNFPGMLRAGDNQRPGEYRNPEK